MSLATHYGKRHLSGELSLDFIARKLKPSQKDGFCLWLVDIMVYTDIKVGDHWPPYEESPEQIYPIVRALLTHVYFGRYAAKHVLSQGEDCKERAFDMLSALCNKDPEILLAVVTHLDRCTQAPTHCLSAIHRLLEAEGESVWLDAAKTTKTKKQLYQLTKWPAVLDQIPRRERGQILEEELGL